MHVRQITLDEDVVSARELIEMEESEICAALEEHVNGIEM